MGPRVAPCEIDALISRGRPEDGCVRKDGRFVSFYAFLPLCFAWEFVVRGWGKAQDEAVCHFCCPLRGKDTRQDLCGHPGFVLPNLSTGFPVR